METDFSFFELLVIKRECTRQPPADIAALIGREVDAVAPFIERYTKANQIVSYDQELLLKARKKEKKLQAHLLKQDNEKRFDEQVKLAKKQKKLEVLNRHKQKNEIKPNLSFDNSRPAMVIKPGARQQKVEDNAWIRRSKSHVTKHPTRKAPRRQEEVKYKTKIVNYSDFTAIRIDAKTIIYAKPGQNPEKVKMKFLADRDRISDNLKFKSAT